MLGDRRREAGFLASISTRPVLVDVQEALTELEAAVFEDGRALRIYRLETERPVDVPDTSRQRLAREEWG